MNFEPLYAMIRKHEGFRSKPYLCPAGVWTIGYGSTKGVRATSPPVSVQQAEAMMRIDAHQAISQALALSPVLASHPQALCAIADFVYNLGQGRYRASTLRKKIDRQDWQGACEQLSLWVWGGGRKLPGLVLRRAEEVVLVRAGLR